jgi:hypothetical protein
MPAPPLASHLKPRLPEALPTAAQLAERLFGGPLRLPSGSWMSWLSDDGTGFPYPEATALAVRTALWWQRNHADWPLHSLIPEVRYLEQAVDPNGVVRQKGHGYLFDSAVSLAALHDAAMGGIPGTYRPLLGSLSSAVRTLISASKATVEPVDHAPWSATFGPHQIKALALAIHAGAIPPHAPEVAGALEALLACQGSDGGFRYPGVPDVLLHAHCYALEGLAMLPSLAPEAFERGLDFLQGCRNRDDTFPARWGKATSLAGDVTAQAARLLALAGRTDSLAANDRGLARCMASCGLVLYDTTSGHRNSWASLFALQYLWMRGGGCLTPQELT